MNSIVIYSFVISLSMSCFGKSCCNGKFGSPINHYDWTEKISNIKNQDSNPTCWAHATTSYLEIVYANLTNTYFKLSVDQIVDNTYQQSLILTKDCERRNGQQGGDGTCALYYVKARGILTKFDYDYFGYDIKKVTPISIKNVNHFVFKIPKISNITMNYLHDNFIKYLNLSPLLVSMYADNLSYDEQEFKLDNTGSRHLVVVTNVCNKDGKLSIEYLNSYGKYWGQCGGYGYVSITNSIGQLINNRNILTEITFADLYDSRDLLHESCNNKNEMVYILNLVQIYVLILILGLTLSVFCKIFYSRNDK